ncbi:MAG TPA: Crp/Fnr family transcriptional regulator [Chitinophagaceae bacterium]|nr:Crp/Fnr family transcriptional regulator [Chitinophagaceae bacterium]
MKAGQIDADGYPRLQDFLRTFGTFSSQDWNEFEAILTPAFYPKGSIIHSENKVCRTAYFILSGCVRIYYINDGGQEISSDFFFDGHIFTAFSSFWKQLPTSENISALQDTTVLAFQYRDVQSLIQRNEAWRNIHSNMLIRLILHTYERDEILAEKDLVQRFKKMLALRPGIFMRAKQIHLASFLGMTHETFSRIKATVIGKNKLCSDDVYIRSQNGISM